MLALLAAFALVLAMAVPAWAEGNKGYISPFRTQRKTKNYKIYQYFYR